MPSRDVQNGSSPMSLLQRFLAQAAGAAPALTGPDPLYAEGRRGGRRPLVPHLTVMSRCGTQGQAWGWALPAPRHVLCVCAWFVFNMWKM